MDTGKKKRSCEYECSDQEVGLPVYQGSYETQYDRFNRRSVYNEQGSSKH
jgi:hypothetical protein